MMPSCWLCFPQPEVQRVWPCLAVCGVQRGGRSAQTPNTPSLHGPGSQFQEKKTPLGLRGFMCSLLGGDSKNSSKANPRFTSQRASFALPQSEPETSPRALCGGQVTDLALSSRFLCVTWAPLGAPLGAQCPASPTLDQTPRSTPAASLPPQSQEQAGSSSCQEETGGEEREKGKQSRHP